MNDPDENDRASRIEALTNDALIQTVRPTPEANEAFWARIERWEKENECPSH